MRRVLLPVLLSLACATAAIAQDTPGPFTGPDGTYFGSGEGEITAKISHINNDVYAVDIQTIVPMENNIPGCGGGISGETILGPTGGNFFVENEFYDASTPDSPVSGSRYCEINISVDDDGFLHLEERDGCMAYHGASCGFSGQLLWEGAVS